MESVRVVVALIEMLRDVLWQVRREPAVAFPDDTMSLVRRVDYIDDADVAGVLLVDPKLSDIKLMKEDPEGVEKSAEDVKKRYEQIFKL